MHRENRLLRWAPRVLGLGMALFLSVFALDAFGEGGLLRNVAGFLIHLIPSFIVLAVLIAAWRRALVGATGFIALALIYVVMTWGRFPLSVYLVIAGPLALTGVLFLASWYEEHQSA
ncbi:MAG: hypothetical protein A3H96_19135 [Acidobacteria bacterium RIFCSPLOWO2_02_FULL_67_36]|nr:MAG: hypothetical protein A3H96_19135 [Acidobacteria bacterium RIFCSPLOWO2_02_FULL_67_36]OFW25237.1 MAG: hypothetical protein A3G21_19660 [Acidobacteria bacterium RIFCSPLOWO2_12_FULL_66_21]